MKTQKLTRPSLGIRSYPTHRPEVNRTIMFPRAALGIVDHLRRRFARFKLCAHFLLAPH